MIILDTNVISEPLRPSPNRRVSDWLDRQDKAQLWTTAINLAELRAGVAVLPAGKRKTLLGQGIEQVLGSYLHGRILYFDENAADAYAKIFAQAKASGRVIALIDAQIAAIAKSRGFAVATRDLKPFAAAGVEVVDPWK